jgi:hypothetical protein
MTANQFNPGKWICSVILTTLMLLAPLTQVLAAPPESLVLAKKLLASDGSGGNGFGTSVALSGDTVIVGTKWSGAAYIFSRNQGGSGNWGEVKKLTPSDGVAGDNFGTSVSLSGDFALVGAYGSGSGAGAAYLFYRNQGGTDNWGEVKKLVAGDGLADDNFGVGVSISGNTALVGASGDDEGTANNKGSAYVFSRNQGGTDNWGLVSKLTADNTAYGFFGSSLSLDGDTAIVGAFRDNENGASSGSAYIFSRNQGGSDNWGLVKKLLADDGAADNFFGFSVAISGSSIIVGAKLDDDNGAQSGSAYLFSQNQGGSNNWGTVRKLLASDGAANDWFGSSVAISGNTAVVAAYLHDNNSVNNTGTVYVFSRNQGGADAWGETDRLVANDASTDDQLGYSATIDTDTIVAGALFGDGSSSDSGSAYLFSPQGYQVSVSVSGSGSVSANSGAISQCTSSSGSCSGFYTQGSNVILTATPANGYSTTWSGANSSACSSNTCTFNSLGSDKSVSASFAQQTYVVSASVDAHGTLDRNSATVNQGATASFVVSAETGYTTNAAVGGNCPAGSWSGSRYTSGAITTNCSLSFTHTFTGGTSQNCTGGAIKEIRDHHYDSENDSCTADFLINMGPAVNLTGSSSVSLTAAGIALKPPLQVANGSILSINASTAGTGSLNQAQLGSLSGAMIHAYRLTDLENSIEGPVRAVPSSSDTGLAGRFGLALEGISDDEWILVSAAAGMDIDADDDGAPDAPIPNAGVFYGLAKAGEWRNGGVRVTALTDLVWRFTRSLVPEAAPTELHIRLNDLAKALLTGDINGDGQIDYHDFHAFVPHLTAHRSLLNFDYQALLIPDSDGNSVIGAHHAGNKDLLDRMLENLFAHALNLYPRADDRYTQVKVEVVLFGRGQVVSDIGGIHQDSETDPAGNTSTAWLTRNPAGKLVLTATPISATEILGWSGCDQISADRSQCVVTLDRGHQVMAKFGYKEITLNAAVHDLSGAAVVTAPTSLHVSILSSHTELIDSLAQLKAGDFVAGPTTDGGYLRKVTAYSKLNETTYQLTTEEANLKDVIAQGTWGFSAPLTNGDLRGYQAPAVPGRSATMTTSAFSGLEGVRLIPSDDPQDTTFHLEFGEPAREADREEISQGLGVVLWEDRDSGAKLAVQGSVDIEIRPELGVSYGKYGLLSGVEDFHFAVSFKNTLDMKFSLEGEVTLGDVKVKVATIPFGTYVVLVGGLPVWIVPEVSIYLGADAKTKLSLSAGVQGQTSLRNGMVYKRGAGGWKTIYEPPFNSWKYIYPSITREATLKGYVEASLQFVIYSVAGPLLGAESYLQLQANKALLNEDIVTGQGCQDGVEASLKFGINAFLKWEFSDDIQEGLQKALEKFGFDKPENLYTFAVDLLKSEWLLKHWYLEGQCVDDPPFLEVSGEDIDAVVDSTNRITVQKSYLLKNIGKGKLPWSVGFSDDPAISVSPTSGELAENESAYVVVEVNTSPLELGTYRNKLSFTNGFQATESMPFGSLGSTFRYISIQVIPKLTTAPAITGFDDMGGGFGRVYWSYDAQSAPIEMWGYEIYLQVDGSWTKIRTATGIDTSSAIISGLPLGKQVCFRIQAYGEGDSRTPNSADYCVQLSGGELFLSTVPSIAETGTATATLRREGNLTTTLTVNLASSDTTEATIPATVTIPQDAASVNFEVAAVDDNDQDGDQAVTLSAFLAGWKSGETTVQILDDDTDSLKFSTEFDFMRENSGGVWSKVSRNGDLTAPLTVSLSSSDTSEAAVQTSVTIAAGEAVSEEFLVHAVDDTQTDGNQVVTLTASATDYTNGSAKVTVIDDEQPASRFTKIRSDGASMPDSATSWDCVKDGVTGLYWEAKKVPATSFGEYQSASSRFSWYNEAGIGVRDNFDTCFGGSVPECDTLSYVQWINHASGYPPMCNISGGWRLPTLAELYTLVDPGQPTTQIDLTYFPYIHEGHWTNTRVTSNPYHQGDPYYINFRSGSIEYGDFSDHRHVILVHD